MGNYVRALRTAAIWSTTFLLNEFISPLSGNIIILHGNRGIMTKPIFHLVTVTPTNLYSMRVQKKSPHNSLYL